MDAVAGDDGAALLRGEIFRAAGAPEMRGSVRLGAGALPAEMKPVLADARLERVEQRHLQIAAMNGKLRPFVPGGAPELLLVDELAEAVEERRLPRRHRDLFERRLEAEPGELP